MGVLSLLYSIISHALTSFTLSLLLPFHCLFPHLTATDATDPRLHSTKAPFGTNVVVLFTILLSTLSVMLSSTLISCLILHQIDHLSPQQARDIAQTNGPVFLLTIPTSVGYQQNPISVYYCYDLEGSTKCLKKCIAEATNTPWGERLHFLFNPNSDVVAKLLHVSPFMDMHGNWIIKTSVPGDHLVINISINHPKLGDYFTASLTANRISSSSVRQTVFFWLVPHKVVIWIYWQILKLWWKKLEFFQHPMYENPSYKKDATARDRNLGCCPLLAAEAKNQQQINQSGQMGRWIRWRDAKWHWF